MTFSLQHGIGKYIKCLPAFAPQSIVAGGAADNVDQNGISIDRRALRSTHLSGLIVAFCNNTLAGANTSAVLLTLKDSADNVSFTTFAAMAAAVVQSGTGTTNQVVEFPVDLANARRYLRLTVNANLSAATVDVALISALLIAGGFDEIPIA